MPSRSDGARVRFRFGSFSPSLPPYKIHFSSKTTAIRCWCPSSDALHRISGSSFNLSTCRKQNIWKRRINIVCQAIKNYLALPEDRLTAVYNDSSSWRLCFPYFVPVKRWLRPTLARLLLGVLLHKRRRSLMRAVKTPQSDLAKKITSNLNRKS